MKTGGEVSETGARGETLEGERPSRPKDSVESSERLEITANPLVKRRKCAPLCALLALAPSAHPDQLSVMKRSAAIVNATAS